MRIFPTDTKPLSLSFCRRVLGGQPAAEPQPEARHPPRRQRQLVLHRLHTTLAGTARRSDLVLCEHELFTRIKIR